MPVRATGAKDCSQGHHWGGGGTEHLRNGAELAVLGDKPANSNVSQGDTAIDERQCAQMKQK